MGPHTLYALHKHLLLLLSPDGLSGADERLRFCLRTLLSKPLKR